MWYWVKKKKLGTIYTSIYNHFLTIQIFLLWDVKTKNNFDSIREYLDDDIITDVWWVLTYKYSVSCAYYGLRLRLKTSVGRVRRSSRSRANNILRCSASAARWRAEGWLHRRSVRRKALVAAASRGGSFPWTQTRANGWNRSDLPRAVLPGRPFGGWSLNTASTPPPRPPASCICVYSACVLTLHAAGPSGSHQPLQPCRRHRYTRWFRNTFHKTTTRIYAYVVYIIYMYTRRTGCSIWRIVVL